MAINIQRVAIFSTAQRITHWLLALGIIFELISAWLVAHADVDTLAWSDWHIMLGQALLLPLLFRIALLFVKGSGHWRFLLPTREQRHVVLQTLKFYASLGRLPCPDWYAFNPVWQPIYVFIIIIMLLTTGTGFAVTGSLSLSGLHAFLASILLYFTLAHLFFVVLHDIKGNGAQISAMLNGYKYFHGREAPAAQKENSVSLDSLLKK